jgi:hypothetical protein
MNVQFTEPGVSEFETLAEADPHSAAQIISALEELRMLGESLKGARSMLIGHGDGIDAYMLRVGDWRVVYTKLPSDPDAIIVTGLHRRRDPARDPISPEMAPP